MNFIKKSGKTIMLFIIVYIVYVLLLTALNYFSILDLYSSSTLNLIFMAIYNFGIGFVVSKKSSNKILINSLKFAIVMILILLFLNLLFIRQISVFLIIYYIVIVGSAIAGCIIETSLKSKRH